MSELLKTIRKNQEVSDMLNLRIKRQWRKLWAAMDLNWMEEPLELIRFKKKKESQERIRKKKNDYS